MLPSHICHLPNGCSINQFLDYGAEIKYDYFGPCGQKYLAFKKPVGFNLGNIDVPLLLCHSDGDPLTPPPVVQRLIEGLINTNVTVQKVDPKFNVCMGAMHAFLNVELYITYLFCFVVNLSSILFYFLLWNRI